MVITIAADDGKGDDRLMTYKQAAARLNCSESTVRRLVEAGELVVFRVGRAPRFRPADLAKYLGGT